MSKQGEDGAWTEAMGRQSKKRVEDQAALEKLRAHLSEFTSNKRRDGETSDLSEDELEVVPDTPVGANSQPHPHQADHCSPWMRRTACFETEPVYVKEDLALKQIPSLNPSTDILALDKTDHVPIHKSWGFCLLGIFAGRFPGKQAVFDLLRRWPHKARVSFHRRGWMVFQFGSEEEMELTRQKGPHAIFGIPLVLEPMSSDFNPNMDPEINIPVWLRLVDLRATLWNEAAISKIASCIGVPLATDYRTLHRENIDGPRIQVIVNAARRPRESLQIRLHTGEDYELKIEYEFMPKYCTKCRSFGHLESGCAGPKDTIRQPQRQGMLMTKRSSHTHNREGNVAMKGQIQPNSNMQSANHSRPPSHHGRSRSRPKIVAQWRPTGNIAGNMVQGLAEVANPREDSPQGQAATLSAFASPNRFDPISAEEDHAAPHNHGLEQTKKPSMEAGPSGVHKTPNGKGPAGETLVQNAQVEMIAETAIADGTPYVNTRTRGTNRSRDPRPAAAASAIARPPAKQDDKGCTKGLNENANHEVIPQDVQGMM